MWNHKANRIADLEARNTHLVTQLEQARTRPADDARPEESATLARLRAELGQAKKYLRATEGELAQARTARARTVQLSSVAIRDCNRYRAAWLSARRRALAASPGGGDLALKGRLALSEKARGDLVDQITELRACNDDLSRQAVTTAGTLNAVEVTR